eukprot:365315-Chlamydomonas_euryale.AAC.7
MHDRQNEPGNRRELEPILLIGKASIAACAAGPCAGRQVRRSMAPVRPGGIPTTDAPEHVVCLEGVQPTCNMTPATNRGLPWVVGQDRGKS